MGYERQYEKKQAFRLPYPEQEHEGRLVLGDPTAVELDRKLKAYREAKQELEKLAIIPRESMDLVIHTAICNLRLTNFPRTIEIGAYKQGMPDARWPKLTRSFWHCARVLADAEYTYKDPADFVCVWS